MSKTEYSDHVKFGAFSFPRKIVAQKFHNAGQSQEAVIYKNIGFNKQLPQQVLEFKIPTDAEVKQIRW